MVTGFNVEIAQEVRRPHWADSRTGGGCWISNQVPD